MYSLWFYECPINLNNCIYNLSLIRLWLYLIYLLLFSSGEDINWFLVYARLELISLTWRQKILSIKLTKIHTYFNFLKPNSCFMLQTNPKASFYAPNTIQSELKTNPKGNSQTHSILTWALLKPTYWKKESLSWNPGWPKRPSFEFPKKSHVACGYSSFHPKKKNSITLSAE